MMLSSVKNTKAIYAEKLQSAQHAEKTDDREKAIRLYEDLISMNYPDPFPFNRLMILYRKEKRYKDELRVINAGIETISNAITGQREKSLSVHGNMNKLKQLSSGIIKSVGLKNDVAALLPEPVPAWTKRKKLVEQKTVKKKKS